MKRLTIIILMVIECLTLHAQSPIETSIQNKYWVYRDRFRKQFIKIGDLEGESLTADKIALNQGSWEYKGKLNFGDVMAFHADYLGILASEFWLLNNEGKSAEGTLLFIIGTIK